MSILKSQATKYSFSPDQISKLIASDLGKDEKDINVHFVIENTADERWGGTSYNLTKIDVTIKK